MAEFQIETKSLEWFVGQLKDMLEHQKTLNIEVKSHSVGKWGMARLWWSWMTVTAKHLSDTGVTMPLHIMRDGKNYGTRPFNANDAHELFTYQWMGADQNGSRYSWAKSSNDGSIVADKSRRFLAMCRHEDFCVKLAINLPKPKDSEFQDLFNKQHE